MSDPNSTKQSAGQGAFPAILFGGGLLTFAVLLYSIRDILNPIVAGILTVVMLYSLRKDPFALRLLQIATVVTLCWAVYDVREVLMPFALAFLFAYLFDPLALMLQRFVPRWVSALLVLLILIGSVIVAGMFLIPPLIVQLTQLIGGISLFVRGATSWYEQGGLDALLSRFNVEPQAVKQFVVVQVSPRVQTMMEMVLGSLLQFVAGTSYAVGQLLNIVIVPFIGFYLLMDFDRMRKGSGRLLRHLGISEEVKTVLRDIDGLVSAYLRGSLLVAGIVAVLAAVVFLIAGVPYALVLGLLIGVLSVVPYVGILASIACSILVILLGPSPTMGGVIFVTAVNVGLSIVNVYVITPRVIGNSMQLHAVVVILSIFVFAHAMGVLGLLIAVPCAAVIAYLLRAAVERRRKVVENG